LEHILGPICLALESNGIDSASGMSLISSQNLASLSYMDRSSGSCHQLVDNKTIDDCAAYTVVKAPGISCHQLVDNITIDDCAAYTARTGDHRDLSLQPPVECDLSTSYYACPVSDTGLLAPLHGEVDGEDKKDTSYSAHPVSDTGLAVLHGEEASPPTLAHPVSNTGPAVLHGEEASPTTLDPGILDDHGEQNHHHAAKEDPLLALVFDWGPLMELPDDSTDKPPLGDTQEEEEVVVLLYSNWSLAKNPHGEPPYYRLPDEELTPASCVELTPPTEVKILTTLADARMLKTCSEDRMLKTCSEDRMLLAPEDKILSSSPTDGTTMLSATDMMCVPSPEDWILPHMSLPKDGELTLLGHGELHDHADGELPPVLLLYDTKLGKFVLGELGTLGLPTMDGGYNYPPPKAMQRPLPAPEPPPLVLKVLVQKN
jgi:hypothetical protein